MDFMKTIEICGKFDELAKDLNEMEFIATLGMTIDYWTSRNGKNPQDIINDLATVSAQVNETEGKAVV